MIRIIITSAFFSFIKRFFVAFILIGTPLTTFAQSFPQLVEDIQPTPAPPVTCPYYQVDFDLFDGSTVRNPTWCPTNLTQVGCPGGINTGVPVHLTPLGSGLSCLNNAIAQATNFCDSHFINWQNRVDHQDNCPFVALAEILTNPDWVTDLPKHFPFYDDASQTPPQYWVPNPAYVASHWRNGLLPRLVQQGYFWDMYDSNADGNIEFYNDSIDYHYYFYMDNNCQRLPAITGYNLNESCKGLGVENWTSPISLLLEDPQSFGSELSFVEFPLDLTQSDKWYVWKASSKAPLLVYTPDGQENITSATQLFGEWTFGGRNSPLFSNISSNRDFAGYDKSSKWDNGFEPLAYLDSNQDGEITGNELNVLSLWFDHNQDGISQKDEIKKLSQVGIDKIFYKNPQKDDKTNSYVLNVGFSRMVNGNYVTGKSIDWFAQSGSSKEELISKLMTNADMCSQVNGVNSQTKAQAKIENQESNTGVINKKVSDSNNGEYKPIPSLLSGLWKWHMVTTDETESQSGGMFMFTQYEDGKFLGNSVVEAKFKEGIVPKVGSRVSYTPLGKITLTKDPESSKRNVSFVSLTKGGVIENTAVLTSDGKNLNGTSKVRLRPAAGHEISFKYQWRATRLQKSDYAAIVNKQQKPDKF